MTGSWERLVNGITTRATRSSLSTPYAKILKVRRCSASHNHLGSSNWVIGPDGNKEQKDFHQNYREKVGLFPADLPIIRPNLVSVLLLAVCQSGCGDGLEIPGIVPQVLPRLRAVVWVWSDQVGVANHCSQITTTTSWAFYVELESRTLHSQLGRTRSFLLRNIFSMVGFNWLHCLKYFQYGWI